MRLSKNQAIVITLLNILIVCLVAIILFYPSLTTGAKTDNEVPPVDDVVADPIEHVKLREASDGLVDEIVRETRLMGYGDETVVDVYYVDEKLFLFGNAMVAGLDFDSIGGFLCVMDGNGKIVRYEYFSGKVGGVCRRSDGFIACSENGLYHVDFDGNVELKLELYSLAVCVATVADDRVAVVTQPNEKSLRLTEYVVASGRVSKGRTTLINSGFTLSFFDCYYFGERYVIAARATNSPVYDAMVFFDLVPGADALSHYYGGTNENSLLPFAVMPYDGGYFALCKLNGLAAIVTVDYNFVTYRSVSLGFAVIEGNLFYANGKYYASFSRANGAITYEIESDLSRRTVTALDGVFVDGVLWADELIAVGRVKTGENSGCLCVLRPYSQQNVTIDVSNMQLFDCIKNEQGLLIVLSAQGGGAVSSTSGGCDVYVILVDG